MSVIMERTIETIYEVYDYGGKSGSFATLKEARACFKKVKAEYGSGSIVQRRTENTMIETEQVIQGN